MDVAEATSLAKLGALTRVRGGLIVDEDTEITGTLDVAQKLTVDSGGLEVTLGGADITGNSNVAGTLDVTQKLTVDTQGVLVSGGGIDVTGLGKFNTGVTVTGATSCQNTLDVTGTTTLGVTTISGKTTINADTDIQGTTRIGADGASCLVVGGLSTEIAVFDCQNDVVRIGDGTKASDGGGNKIAQFSIGDYNASNKGRVEFFTDVCIEGNLNIIGDQTHQQITSFETYISDNCVDFGVHETNGPDNDYFCLTFGREGIWDDITKKWDFPNNANTDPDYTISIGKAKGDVHYHANGVNDFDEGNTFIFNVGTFAPQKTTDTLVIRDNDDPVDLAKAWIIECDPGGVLKFKKNGVDQASFIPL